MERFFKHTPPVCQSGVLARVERLNARSVKASAKTNALKMALGMIDLTTLEGKDTAGKVNQLCYKAQHPADDIPGLPMVAAVCVYPRQVKIAVKALKNSPVLVASVATGFPAGQVPLQAKLADTRQALDEGAHEIDMVISRNEFLQGDYNFVYDEIASIKQLCGKSRLKVILETGELGGLDNVRKASDLAIQAGADFIKTSTGKIQPAATQAVTLVMLEAIRDHYDRTGKMTGMKPAGGISTAKVALQYLVMVNEVLGEAWLNKHWFRFGASSLANDILLQLGKEQQGAYYSKDRVSID